MSQSQNYSGGSGDIVKISLVLIGDSGSGKFELGESLAIRQTEVTSAIARRRQLENNRLPIIIGDLDEDIHELVIKVVPGGEEVTTFLEPKASTEIRVEIILFCISLDKPDSIKRINSHWLSQLCVPALVDLPLIIVGTKGDLRSEGNQRLVNPEKAQHMANWIGAIGYVEFSAKSETSPLALFEMIASAASLKDRDRQGISMRRVASHADNSSAENLKIVLVGEGASGKNCLAKRFSQGSFVEGPYEPTPFEQYEATSYTVAINNNQRIIDVPVTLWVTAARNEMNETIDYHNRLRAISYAETDAILLCLSVDSTDWAIGRLEEYWLPEIRTLCGDVPVILVGTKVDARDDPETILALKALNKTPLTQETGIALAKKIRAVTYVECSAKTGDNVSEVFEVAVKAVLDTERYQQKNCTIL